MPKISRFKIEPENLDKFLNNFWSVITVLENKQQVKIFLSDLLTHTEMKMFAKRIQIAKMLLEGYDYRAIKGYIKVTDSTISNISNKLESGAEGLKFAAKFLIESEREKEDKRLRGIPDIKKKYPTHFLNERILEEVGKSIRKRRKRKSAQKIL